MEGANRSGRMPTKYVVTRRDIAALAGVTVEAIYRAEKQGRLRVRRPARGRRPVLDLASVVDYVQRTLKRRPR